MKKSLLLLVFAFSVNSTLLKAQITLDSADFGSIGDTIVMVVDSLPVGISVGNTGGPNVWDFTSLGYERLDTFYFLSPSATTNGTDFPGSNLALETPFMNPYFIKSDSQVNLYGIFLKKFGGIDIPFSIRFENYLKVMEFPTNYLSVINDTASVDTIFRDPNFGAFLDSARIKRTIYIANNFDAYGVVNTPSGSDTCLRQNRVEISIDSIWIKGVITAGLWSFQNPLPYINTPNPIVDTQYVYSWFAKNRDYAMVELRTNKTGDTVRVANYQVLEKVFAYDASAVPAKCKGDCNGSATVLTVSGISPYTYLWSSGASAQSTSTATGLCAGDYSVTVYDAIGDSSINVTTVTEPGLLTVTLTVIKDTCPPCGKGKITAAASGGTTAYTYSWSNSYTGPTNPNLQSGYYSVTVYDGNACSVTKDSIQVTVGMGEIYGKNSTISVFPNPVNDHLILKNLKKYPVQFMVFDITGRSVISAKLNAANPSVSVKELPEGLYNFMLKNEKGGEVVTGRFNVVR